MNWLRFLLVMVTMVGCPAVSTVLHNEDALKVHSVDLQDVIVDESAADITLIADDQDSDSDKYLSRTPYTAEARYVFGDFTYQSRIVSSFRTLKSIRAPPSNS